MLQAGRSRDRIPMRSLNFSVDLILPTMALGSTQPLTEMSTRNLPGAKKRLVRNVDNLTAIFEPTVCKMWEPRRFTPLRAFTACYKDSFYSMKLQVNYNKWTGIMRKKNARNIFYGSAELSRCVCGKTRNALCLGKA
jgi:hypothetical protein